MKDKGIVISTHKDFASVEVFCFSTCSDCSAHSFCKGYGQEKGVLSVKNHLKASQGDKVVIEVPEGQYHKSLIYLFGGLLIFGLLGLVIGYLFSNLVNISGEKAILIGFFIGIFIGTINMTWYLKKKNKFLFPDIIEIVQKGVSHGQA